MTQEARPPSGEQSPWPSSGAPTPPAHVPERAGQVPGAHPVPPGGYPAAGSGPPGAAPTGPWSPAPPPREAAILPRRVDPVPGTPFGLVYLGVPPVTSGPAIAALVAGIASILVSLLVLCFGVAGARQGWGAWTAGAFTVPGVLAGTAAVLLGLFGRRQINRRAPPPRVRFTGGRLAVAGMACGGTGLGLSLVALLLAVGLQAG